MSSLYLIRHGQAGTRDHYDALSDLGHQQAYLLGRYLAAQNVEFKAFVSGCRNRQQQTAAGVLRAYREAGVAAPEVTSDPGWNEFDMTAVFAEFAPLLASADARFKQDYEELLQKLQDKASPIQHAWTDCDTQAMRAWMEGRFECRTESWTAFRERVLACRARLDAFQPGDAIAVVTSATPISIWVAAALGADDRHVMRLAGVMYNSAVSTFRIRRDDVALFSFNSVAHLDEPRLRTFR